VTNAGHSKRESTVMIFRVSDKRTNPTKGWEGPARGKSIPVPPWENRNATLQSLKKEEKSFTSSAPERKGLHKENLKKKVAGKGGKNHPI